MSRDLGRRLREFCHRAAGEPALALALVAFAGVLLAAFDALARPGGGHSYSGGGSSSGGGTSGGGHSGGGGGGDGDGLIFLIWLCIEHPAIGIPVAVVVGVVVVVKKVSGRGKKDWSTAMPAPGRPARAQPVRRPVQVPARKALAQLARFDPDFSTVLFEDFVYALYAKAHEARGAGLLDSMAPYLTPQARAGFHPAIAGLAAVKGVVIGSMRVARVGGIEAASPAVRVQLDFETNFTEVARRPDGKDQEQTYYVTESWTLVRPKSARSRPPDKARVIGCPACGAALDAIRGSQCSFCGKQVDTGEHDWRVESLQVKGREPRPPQLTSNVEEQGTDLPTVIDADAPESLRAISARDPAFQWTSFQGRVGLIFGELQVAWSTRDWMKARPYVSDNLFQMQLYWMETYQRAGLRNVTEGSRITNVQLAAVSSDKFYDAITVRLYASGKDFTVRDSDGAMVSGSRTKDRRYSEYWTLLRGASRQGEAHTSATCPNCGAPVKVTMAGSCEFCQAKVTTGEFDWVLSRIEQDESYDG